MYIPIKDAVREYSDLDVISEAKKSAAFLYKYRKVDGSAKVSSLLNPLSPILRFGQLGYTEGVFNCISLAVPKRIMHTIPGRAIDLMPKFFQGLSDDDMAEVLVAGGASSGERVLAEILGKINDMGI